MATQLDNQFILSLDRDNHTCKITSFKSKDDSSIFDLTIPSKIEQDGEEYTVTSIGYGAFSECPRLTSITIPDSVTEIGDEAFAACKNLTSVFIPDSITKIGEGTFRGCKNLNIGLLLYDKGRKCYGWVGNKKVCKGAIIPDGVTSIDNYAFARCTKLTNITIPDGVTYIGDKAFCECSSLTSIIIPDNVTSIGKEAFYRCSSLTSITIPDSVTSIGALAFFECSSLTSITIPDSVTSIGDSAFSKCSSLTSITIPDGVTSIGSYAFHYCEKLTSINIPDSVTEIGVGAFDGCEKLTSITVSNVNNVTPCLLVYDKGRKCYGWVGNEEVCEEVAIPDGVTSIGAGAFSGCEKLTSINIPDGVTSIGGGAFSGCKKLTSINIPNGVTDIGDGAFSGCEKLTSINIPNSVTDIEETAFSGCKKLTSINIPNGVTDIKNWFFSGCSSLTSITIPNSVTWIGVWAFSDCSSLTSITIPNSVTWIGNMAFSGCSSLTNISTTKHNVELEESIFNGCTALSEDVKDKFIRDCDARIGKEICNQLRKIRVEIAKRNGIDFTPAICNHKGDCSGTCPVCEQELEYLQGMIEEKKQKGESIVDFKDQGYIPVDKVESDTKMEDPKEKIEPKLEITNKIENLEHIDALQKSLSEDWAAIEFCKFSKDLNIDTDIFVTSGLIAPTFDKRFIDLECEKIYLCTNPIDKAILIEKQLDNLEMIRHCYESRKNVAPETRLADKSVALKRIELLTYNLEKIKRYNPDFEMAQDSLSDNHSHYRTEEEFNRIKNKNLAQIEDYINCLSHRWEIKNYEFDAIKGRVDEMIAKEEKE